MNQPPSTFLNEPDIGSMFAVKTSDAGLTYDELVQEASREQQRAVAGAQAAMRSELALIAQRDPAALKHYQGAVQTGAQWSDADLAKLSALVRRMWLDKIRFYEGQDAEQAAAMKATVSYSAVKPRWRRIAESAAASLLKPRYAELDATQLAYRNALVLERRNTK